jgi:glycosyltransferase involved in cell wall biosynthesis
MNELPRVVLTHVNVAPFVQQAARAFHEYGMLTRMLTTVVDRPNSIWQRIACRVARLAHFDLAGQLRRRAVCELPSGLVANRAWPELVRLGVGRLDRTGVWSDLAHEWMETGFDRWVARSGIRGANIVYGYENACSATFRAAAIRGLFRIYDAPAPEHRFSKMILEAERENDAVLDTAYQRHIRKPQRELKRDGRRQSEYTHADLIVTASTVTRDSFAEYFRLRGRDAEVDKLVIVPYGAPVPDPEGERGGSGNRGPVRLIWAGSFSVRKGARYLIEAWRQISPSSAAATLDVYGTTTVPQALLVNLPDSIRFHGPVSRDELFRAYRGADLLVFPSLCDGFGMVVTEALSRGVPVLTTRRAGAADLIRRGDNGFVIEPGSADELASALEQAIHKRGDLAAMRPAALGTAAKWQWSDYRRELVRKVLEKYWMWRKRQDGTGRESEKSSARSQE